MFPLPALMLCLMFFGLAGLHLFWAFSDRVGGSGVIPTVDGVPVMEPGRASTLAVAALLIAAAIVSLWRGGWPDAGPVWVPRLGIWVIAAVFGLRALGDFRTVGFFKKVRGTAFSRNDSLIYSPLCLAISVLAVLLAVFY